MALGSNISDWVIPGLQLLTGSVSGGVFFVLVALGLLGILNWLWSRKISSGELNAASQRVDKIGGKGVTSPIFSRCIILRGVEHDDHGHTGERLRYILSRSLRKELASPRNGWAKFKVKTGVVENGGGDFFGENSKATKRRALKRGSGPDLSLSLHGQVSGLELKLAFFPQGPVIMEKATATDEDVPRQGSGQRLKTQDSDVEHTLSYECFDFPLFQLYGLTRGLPALQGIILPAMVAGLSARGAGINGVGVPKGQILRWAQQLDSDLEGLKLTQPVLYQEGVVVTAWCFLIAGLLGQDAACLRRALYYYDIAKTHEWRGRDLTEWAGIKANEAMAALVLAQMTDGSQFLYRRVMDCALEGMRHFRRDNFPASWGKMMCKIALANGAITPGALNSDYHKKGDELEVAPDKPQINNPLGGETEVVTDITSKSGCLEESGLEAGAEFSSHDYKAIETSLDHAIDFWQRMGDFGAIAEAHFAKGFLARNSAQRHMGLQNWQQAENAFLAAMATGRENDFWPTRRRSDIRFELARLYLEWGTRFGDRGLLEKAINHFGALLDRPAGLAPNSRSTLSFYLAQATLNCGGITNDPALHLSAIDQLSRLKEQRPLASSEAGDAKARADIERMLAVAEARAALSKRDRRQARKAVSLISAVIGQNNGHWPQRDVLLRLRARLRGLLFQLEGDDMALDRAISDRRELVAIASEGLLDLRWAVEVGDLVGLLSQRQYKLDGEGDDFHEAHYLLEKALSICAGETVSEKDGMPFTSIPHIEAGLHLRLGQLLAVFGRVQFDLSALNEALLSFEKFLKLTPRSGAALSRAQVLNDIGQIMMDRSEHYGQHDGLRRAMHCFAEAHDIYLEAMRMDQANRMRRFLENAEAAVLAYQVPPLGHEL